MASAGPFVKVWPRRAPGWSLPISMAKAPRAWLRPWAKPDTKRWRWPPTCHRKPMRQTWPMRPSSGSAESTGLVNNAAVFQRPAMFHGPFEEMSVEEWDRLMAVNLRGVFLCTRAVVPTMKQQRSGKIVNISSGTVAGASAASVHYVTSKAGVIGFTRSLARSLGDYNINVNAIAPGATLSMDDLDGSGAAGRQAYNQNRAIKRQEVPQDVVGPVIFLCSHDSDFVTGQTVAVNGGVWMH